MRSRNWSRTLTERSGGNGAVLVFMACYDCFVVQSMPRASKQQARYAVGRCLMLWSSNDVTQQGSRPKTKLGITKYSIVTNSNDSVTLRLMTEHDLAMLYEWLNRSHIVEWWGGEEARPTLADVQEQYLPSVLAQESVTPYIAMLNGEPIGYAQSYVALGSGDGWWEEETDPGVRGIDQSLANASQLGKGLGTKLVRALVELLFNDPEVTKIQTDPSPSNLRAIRCYEKAGFERQGTVTTPDGPAVYMVQTRQAFERTRSDA
ncbi:Aminoglycoside N(6')-acetyltransferase type 1 [Pseudomonas aeruginosa]|nr:Aminoglycoside N(6')-acetyltransferase type 1 [Pseudomonas aeruginosa]